ncbi:hypothetical protein AOQ84DRAFT_370841 [Glonium stellatum]|uniref:Uncharacterized protein n=1 Tax=Glonium stellatum TaxID=574774 RepID=A0A8E2FDR2_9PEZI|nr:hypothetical protein AOQ84DRAFT_370841 [Glonium stellatum]
MFATTHPSKPFSFARFQRFFLIVALLLNGIVLLHKFGPKGWVLPTSQLEALVPAARVVAWEQ